MLSLIHTGAAGVVLACASAAFAQQAIFSNASADPAVPALNAVPNSTSGVPAPVGGMWSELTATSVTDANALAGMACNTDTSGGVRLADNFIVPEGQAWNLSEVWLYVYQTGWATTTSPVAGATLRIWYGQPGTPFAAVVWGDTVTNRYASAQATNAYRIFTTEAGPPFATVDSSRRVFRVALSIDATLTPGEYWLDWQLTPTSPGATLFAAAATIPDFRTEHTWNAQQYADGLWTSVIDPGKPAPATDLPLDAAFILTGTVGTACDSIDFNGDTLLPDVQDITDFLIVFAGGACPTGTCGDIDFNNDGLLPDVLDIEALLSVFAGGPCLV